MRDSNDPNPNRAPWVHSGSDSSFGTNANAAPFQPSNSGSQATKENKRRFGCWVWGCLGVVTFTLLAITGIGFASYYVYTAQVDKYTDTKPAELPVVEMKQDELVALEERIESFTTQVRPQTEAVAESTVTPPADTEVTAAEGGVSDTVASEPADQGEAQPPVRELVLTANEINGLIAARPDMRGRLFVKIKDGAVSGQVSFPTDMLPGASGRFFNADADFDVSLEDGLLVVRLTGASVKGEQIPEPLLDGLSKENLAKDLYNDPKNAEMLRKFESIQVVDESIVLRLKSPQAAPQSELDSKAGLGTATEAGPPRESSGAP